MNTRNPYEYNPYALDDEARPRGVKGLFDQAFGMIGCLAALNCAPKLGRV